MRALWMAVAVSLLGVPLTGHAASLRCGKALVADGALMWEVAAKCGEPGSRYSRPRPEEVETRDGDTKREREVDTSIEEWTYNFGPNRLIQVVVFKDGKLIDVRSGGYGR